MSESVTVSGGDEVVVVDAGAELAGLRARLLQAELQTAAVRAGMVDLDGVKLIEPGALNLDAKGGLVDGAGVMKALRAAKPWLFGGNSSSVAVAPRAEAAVAKTAMTMTVDEWRAARTELLKRK